MIDDIAQTVGTRVLAAPHGRAAEPPSSTELQTLPKLSASAAALAGAVREA